MAISMSSGSLAGNLQVFRSLQPYENPNILDLRHVGAFDFQNAFLGLCGFRDVGVYKSGVVGDFGILGYAIYGVLGTLDAFDLLGLQVFRVSRYCLLESLAHANFATAPDGEMTVMERRQWNSGFCQDFLNSSTWEEPRPQWNSGFSQDLLASVEAWGEYWENEAWDNWQSQQFWSSQSEPAGSPGTSWTK